MKIGQRVTWETYNQQYDGTVIREPLKADSGFCRKGDTAIQRPNGATLMVNVENLKCLD